MNKVKLKKTRPTIYFGVANIPALVERMDCDHKDVLFTRVWAMPNHQTFKIKPIASMLARYVKQGQLWVDPFAGANSPAGVTNDHNPAMPTTFHMEALEFAKSCKKKKHYDGVLFDPPYSFRQISEHYKHVGMKATQWHTSMAFYEKVKSEMCEKVAIGGHVISFGWNSNGFGKARGFRVVEIMLIAHGGSKNDTIVTVEKRVA